MAIATGFSKATTEGLILGYDTADLVNSYLGRPTTNLVGTGMSIYNNVGGNVSATLATNGEYYRGAPVYVEVLTALNGTGVSQLSNGNNPGIGVVSGGGGGLANRYTGHSIFFKPTVPMHSSPIFTNYSNIGGWQSSTNYEDMGDGWFRAYVIWYNTVDGNDGKYWAINPLTATQGVPITIYWAGPFKEDLNVQNVSQYTTGTRSSTQGVVDFKRVYNLDVTNVSFTSDIRPVTTFDGTNDYISTNLPDTTLNENSWTMEAVVKFNTVNKGSDNAIFGHGTVGTRNGLHLSERTTTVYFGFYSDDIAGSTAMVANRFYHICWVYNRTTAQKFIYLNAVLDGSGTQNTYIGAGNNFEVGRYPWGTGNVMSGNIPVAKMYNRVLTPGEIRQNYNLYRTRFNI
jgi:hypothetical protein